MNWLVPVSVLCRSPLGVAGVFIALSAGLVVPFDVCWFEINCAVWCLKFSDGLVVSFELEAKTEPTPPDD